mmetsp:Transcript_43239/g.112217  ORF Transcript_43239/g.112217 Transcript_43239/m.112217 type:complete len:204 (+) Transcript_43239:3839-4450(+)
MLFVSPVDIFRRLEECSLSLSISFSFSFSLSLFSSSESGIRPSLLSVRPSFTDNVVGLSRAHARSSSPVVSLTSRSNICQARVVASGEAEAVSIWVAFAKSAVCNMPVFNKTYTYFHRKSIWEEQSGLFVFGSNAFALATPVSAVPASFGSELWDRLLLLRSWFGFASMSPRSFLSAPKPNANLQISIHACKLGWYKSGNKKE